MPTPVSPVLPNAKTQPTEIKVAEHQEQYQTLPAIHDGQFSMISRWEFTDEEIEQINQHKSIWVSMMNFGRPIMPLLIETAEPVLLMGEDLKEYNESKYGQNLAPSHLENKKEE